MSTKLLETMTEEQIISFFYNTKRTSSEVEKTYSEAERAYIKEYRTAIDQAAAAFLENLLNCAAEDGKEEEVHKYTFELEENSHLAEICPNGESGSVSLIKFCRLFFVKYEQYGEGSEIFGPWQNKKKAKQAFENIISINEPG